jgi:hypothetical protein
VVDVITAEDVPGDNNHNGEILYARHEVCDLHMAYFPGNVKNDDWL